jgi:hypothetical protein
MKFDDVRHATYVGEINGVANALLDEGRQVPAPLVPRPNERGGILAVALRVVLTDPESFVGNLGGFVLVAAVKDLAFEDDLYG